MAVHFSLLEAPSNLKESLDWIVAVRRCSAIPMLEKATYTLLLHGTPVLPETASMKEGDMSTNVCSEDTKTNCQDIDAESKTITGSTHVADYDVLIKPTLWIENLVMKLYFMDVSAREVKRSDLYRCLAQVSTRIQLTLLNLTKESTYVESYDKTATWRNSCAGNPYKCAEVFVSLLIRVYNNLNLIKRECKRWLNLDSKLNGAGSRAVGDLFASMGYNVKDFIPRGTCRDILKYYETLNGPLMF
ncbi:hypothetical protein, conserved [Babesia ovata]|uniref:Uncharacterized protein n=1 Tax=Babesia ovata TaxID=189622 RepID=A0A2H6KCS1_9APIC|nr:uncharacterized protein BOVATA_022670 [Babesia ovata]GBE60774.1 hypothetical protein, conserved [Babesia ovata]